MTRSISFMPTLQTSRPMLAHNMPRSYTSTSLSPQITRPNSVKITTPLSKLAPKNIRVDKVYVVSCTNSRSSDLKAAAKVFQDAAKASSNGEVLKVADHVQLYIAAASINEQKVAEKDCS